MISSIRMLDQARAIHLSRRNGGVDPLALTPEIRRHVGGLLPDHNRVSTIDRALLLFRSVIPAGQSFSFGGTSYSGLPAESGGLNVYCNTDCNNRLRRQTNGLPLPTDIINAPKHDASRIAKCVEYSFLLISLLRAADLEAHLVKDGLLHTYAAARLGGEWYKLDAFYIDKKLPPRFELLPGPVEYLSERLTLGLFHSNKAEVLKQQRHREKALMEVKTAIEIAPDLAEAWINYGAILLELNGQGSANEAMAAFKKALSLEPDNSVALNNAAVLLIKEGKRDEAKRIFNEILDREPGNESARRNLVNLNGGPFLAGLLKGLL